MEKILLSFQLIKMYTDPSPVLQTLDALQICQNYADPICSDSGSTTLGKLVSFLPERTLVMNDIGHCRVYMNCTFACDALSALLRLG